VGWRDCPPNRNRVAGAASLGNDECGDEDLPRERLVGTDSVFWGQRDHLLVLGLGFLQNLNIPGLNEVITFVEGLPMIGARGLLIGIGIGLLMMAFRVLFGMEGSGND